jgi:hypothetical protein
LGETTIEFADSDWESWADEKFSRCPLRLVWSS